MKTQLAPRPNELFLSSTNSSNSNILDLSNLFEFILKMLPNQDDLLNLVGLGSKGPPIPEPVQFQLVNYPHKKSNLNKMMNKQISSSKSSLNKPSFQSYTSSKFESNLTNLGYFQFLSSGCGDPVCLDSETADTETIDFELKNKVSLVILFTANKFGNNMFILLFDFYKRIVMKQ